jgi:purine-binding chemotaxis protein CheW
VRGVINLRGAVLPILDLKARLGLGLVEPSARSVIIVVHIGDRLVGLLVDAVSEILAAEKGAVQPTPNVGCETVSRFVRGILAIEGRMISWIALNDILPEQQEAEAA